MPYAAGFLVVKPDEDVGAKLQLKHISVTSFSYEEVLKSCSTFVSV